MIQIVYFVCASLWRRYFKSILFVLFIVNILLFTSSLKTNNGEPSKAIFKKISNNVSQSLNSKKLFDKKKLDNSPKTVNSKKHINFKKLDAKKLIILFTNKRSGSSFAGELLNQISNSFYLFEPLFPFTRECDILKMERVEALQTLLQCQFENITEIYKSTFRLTNHTDAFAKCIQNSICFIDRHKSILNRYEGLCKKRPPTQRRKCQGYPLDFELVSQICSFSRVIAFKILRICDISTLQGLVKSLENQPNVQLKIIHLIRDPRAILSSRLLLNLDETTNETLRKTASLLCQRLTNNVKYADNYWKDKKSLYFRVRFEDLAIDPLKKAQQIYDFIGEMFPGSVYSWLQTMIHKKENSELVKNQFGLDRKPDRVVNSWRKNLGLKQVRMIQEECDEAMKQLAYSKVLNEDELHDISGKILF